MGIAAAELDAAGAEALLHELCGTFAAPPAAKSGAVRAGGEGDAHPKPAKPRARFEEIDGSLAAAGYVLAQCMTGAHPYSSHCLSLGHIYAVACYLTENF